MNTRKFLEWLTDADTFGCRYAAVIETQFPGIRWALMDADGEILFQSQGSFYDGAEDHLEGAIEWARTAAKKDQAKLAESLKEITEKLRAL